MPQLVHEPHVTVLSALCTNHQWRRNGVRKRESGAVRLGQTVFFSFLGWTPFYFFFFLRLATSFYVDDWDGQHSFNIDDWDGQHFLCWWLKWVTFFYVDDWEAQHFLCWWQSWATNSGYTAGSKISYLRHCLPLFEIKPKKQRLYY